MKLWLVILLIVSFLFWYLVGKIWAPTTANPFVDDKEDSYVFPTPKINTVDPFTTPTP